MLNLITAPELATSWHFLVQRFLDFKSLDVNKEDKNGLTALDILASLPTDFEEKNPPSIANDYFDAVRPSIVSLIAAGATSWSSVPSPCPGIHRALYQVWKVQPENLHHLVSKMSDPMKERMRAFLCCLHRPLSGHRDVCMMILSMGLDA